MAQPDTAADAETLAVGSVAAWPSTGIVAISSRGGWLARQLAAAWPGGCQLYLERRRAAASAAYPGRAAVQVFDRPLRPLLERLFQRHRQLVLFMPVGAAVRLLAPSLQHKHRDPAVVCVDSAGQFAVSLLSGHVGGADRLAEEVAQVLGARPVITSASHSLGTLAVDLLGREFGWRISSHRETVTRVSAAVVNGEPVGIVQEAGEPDWWPQDRALPANLTVYPSIAALKEADSAAALIISDRSRTEPPFGREEISPGTSTSRNTVYYHPRSLVVGMGCRRGVEFGELQRFLERAFMDLGLSELSIARIATAEIKGDEAGLLDLAAWYGVPLVCYSTAALNRVFEALPEAGLTRSEAARRLLGVWGVSEPAALLAAGSRELLSPRRKSDRATLAVARITYGQG